MLTTEEFIYAFLNTVKTYYSIIVLKTNTIIELLQFKITYVNIF